MKNLLERYGFRRSPEGEGDSGAAAGAAGANAAAAAGTGGDAGGGAGAGGPGAGGTASPGGDGGAGPGESPATPYFPEGLPEAMRGKSERETLDKVSAALKGYREQDAARDVPADEKGYLSTEGLQIKIDDAQKPYFEALEKDPAFAAIAKVAKEHKVGRRAFLEMWQAGMKAMGAAGLLEPAIDETAEREALLPDGAKILSPDAQSKAIDKRMQENFDFLDLIAENRGPADAAAKAQLKQDVEYAQLMLGDSAKGHRFIEFLKNTFNAGGGAVGAGGGGGGGDSKESLRAELAKPEMKPGHPSFDQKKFSDLQERYKKVHGA